MATKWQKVFAAKKKMCTGKATVAQVKKAAAEYVADAVKKGKPKATAMKSVSKLMATKCAVNGKPVKRTRKKTVRRAKAA